MENNFFVFDNIIPQKYQNDIENLLLKNQTCPWYMVEDMTYSNTNDLSILSQKFIGFSHVFKNESGVQSKVYDFLLPLVYTVCEKINYDFKSIVMARSFLQLPNTQGTNNPHIDFKNPHTVLLYYVNDSQGPTVLYEEQFPDIAIEEVHNKKLTIKEKIDPKKGRCVVFNGFQYHSSSGPSHNARCVINFDLI